MMRPEFVELPIALNATPCISMLLHPGRVATSTQQPLVRIALVCMLVRDALPEQISIRVRMPAVEECPSLHSCLQT